MLELSVCLKGGEGSTCIFCSNSMSTPWFEPLDLAQVKRQSKVEFKEHRSAVALMLADL